MEIDAVVDERTRREIYFPPFEAAVRRAGVWAVMAAYNRVDGQLLQRAPRPPDRPAARASGASTAWSSPTGSAPTAPTRSPPGWTSRCRGPAQVLGSPPGAAVEAGDVAAEDVERAASRVLDLIERTVPSRRAAGDRGEPTAERRRRCALAAATEGIVLLANDGVLPLDAGGRAADRGDRLAGRRSPSSRAAAAPR